MIGHSLHYRGRGHQPANQTTQTVPAETIGFKAYVEDRQAGVFSLVVALLGDRSNADSVAQQVFVDSHRVASRPWRRLPDMLWLYRRATHLAWNFISSSENQSRRAALDVLRRLSADERLLLVLRDVQGYAVGEIARIFKTEEEDIRTALLKARKRAARVRGELSVCTH